MSTLILSEHFNNASNFATSEIDRLFEEEPVSLDVFLYDPYYLGFPRDPGLSKIQYEALQYAERVYKNDTYPLLAEAYGGYWEEVKDLRMTNLLVMQWAKGCLLAGEEVYDAQTGQWVPVEKLQAGKTVGVSDELQASVYSHSASFYRGIGESFEVVTNTGLRLKVFGGHKFLTKDGYKELWHLKPGDYIAQVSKLDNVNPVTLDSREVELLGWWLGDGIMPKGKSGLTMMFAEHETESLTRYLEICDSLGVSQNVRQREGKKCYYVNSTTLSSGNGKKNPLLEIARKYEVAGKTAHSKRVPKEIFSTTDDQIRLFISRLWSTDGTFYASKTRNNPSEASYTTVNEYLAQDIQRLLLRLGISSEITAQKTRFNSESEYRLSYRVRVRTKEDLLKFCTEIPVMDKTEKQKSVVDSLNLKIDRKNPYRDGDIRWTTIREIIPLGNHPYYDLTVDEVSNYVAGGGLVSHNSGKDLISRLSMLRIAYLLMCLRSPQDYFGMPTADSIHCLNIAVNANQARLAYFEPMTRSVKRGWFADKSEPKKSSIRFAKGIEAISGHSSVDGQEGLNLLVGVADEIDGFKTRTEMVGLGRRSREASSSAEAILNMLRSSAVTRFPEVYKQITISFPRYKGSKIQQLTEEAKKDIQEHGRSSNYFVSGPYATWVVNPLKQRKDFELEYRKDPVEAAAKYECNPAGSSNPYFRDMNIFKESIDRKEPAIKVSYELQTTVSEETGAEIEQWEPVFEFADWFRPVPGAMYAVHGDLAIVGDRAGIAMSHIVDWVEKPVTYVTEENLIETRTERLPIIRNDFTISFEADISSKPAREIKIRWARELIFELIRRGFLIERVTYDQYQCLSGDTKIPLLDGTVRTMKELAETEFEHLWVYSMSPEGRVTPGKLTKAWKTGFRDDMVEVELDNGETIRSTSDHRFMLRDGTYKQAMLLEEGESLMPLYRRMKKTSPTSAYYEQIWHPEADGSGQRWRFTHSMVSHYFYGKLPKGWLTHHIDHTKLNNAPENLQQMTWEEHNLVHTQVLYANGEHPFEKSWADPDWREAHKKRISASVSARQLGRKGREANRFRQDIRFEDIEASFEEYALSGIIPGKLEIMRSLNISQELLYSRLREKGYKTYKQYKDLKCPPNNGALKTRDSRKRKKTGGLPPSVLARILKYEEVRKYVFNKVSIGESLTIDAVASGLRLDSKATVRSALKHFGFTKWNDFLISLCLEVNNEAANELAFKLSPLTEEKLFVGLSSIEGEITQNELLSIMSISKSHLQKFLRNTYDQTWIEFLDEYEGEEAPVNHSVVSVRSVESEDVYDLQVDKYHNFATEAGVFVHNSKDSMQILEDAGIETDRVSTDINNNVWRTLKDVASDGRLRMEDNKLLLAELEALIDLGRKVDHPPTQGKDLADAFGCSIVGAIELGGAENYGYDEIQVGSSIFNYGVTNDNLLANMPGVDVSLEGLLPVGMTLEAPFGFTN